MPGFRASTASTCFGIMVNATLSYGKLLYYNYNNNNNNNKNECSVFQNCRNQVNFLLLVCVQFYLYQSVTSSQ